jgi:uncharacterized FlaG/YvyC family protein
MRIDDKIESLSVVSPNTSSSIKRNSIEEEKKVESPQLRGDIVSIRGLEEINKKIDNYEEKKIDDAIKKMNVNSDILNKNLKFEKDYYYDKLIVKIYNKETGDEIKQIPAKEVLEFAKKSEEIIGLLFDEII